MERATIDTRKKCFLCLQGTDNPKEVDDVALLIKLEIEYDNQLPHGKLASVLSIVRYLRINPAQIIRPQSAHGPFSNADTISNLFVILCDDCHPVVSRLSDLCLELEVLHMKLDHQLKSFCDVLDSSEKYPQRICDFRSALTAEQLATAESLRERMREETRRICTKTEIIPKVLVSKVVPQNGEISREADLESECYQNSPAASSISEPDSPRPETYPGNASKSNVSYQCNLCPCKFALVGSLARHRRTHHGFGKQQRPPPSLRFTCKLCSAPFSSKHDWMKHVNSECPHIVTDMANYNKDDHYNCPLCHEKIRVTETKRHKIRRHVDTLLTSYKLPHLSPSEFKQYCDHVFKVELLLCRKTEDGKGRTTLECSNCSKCYSSTNSARNHLFLAHRQVMGNKLVELQKSTGLQEINSTKLPTSHFQNRGGRGKKGSASKRNSSCLEKDVVLKDTVLVDEGLSKNLPTDCKQVLCILCEPHRQMKMKDLRRHKMRRHIESFLTEHKAPSVSMSDFKLFCKQAFQEEISGAPKVYDSAGKPGWQCRHCSRTVSDGQYLQQHLYVEHREYMQGRIVELQVGVVSGNDGDIMEDKAAKMEPEDEEEYVSDMEEDLFCVDAVQGETSVVGSKFEADELEESNCDVDDSEMMIVPDDCNFSN